MSLISVSAIAGEIEYLGESGHLPAVVCGSATGGNTGVKDALRSMKVSLEELKEALSLKDLDIKISDLTYTVSQSSTLAESCVLVSSYTERAIRAEAKEHKDKAFVTKADGK